MAVITQNVQWEPVAVPLFKGIDLNTRARLVDPSKLLSATNMYFPRDGGLEKRKGNVASVVYDLGTKTDQVTPSNWLYGWGHYDTVLQMDTLDLDKKSQFPDCGPLNFGAKYDDEVLVADSFNLYSKVEGGFTRKDRFIRPAFTSKTLSSNSTISDMGCNGKIKVVASRKGTEVKVKVYDYVHGGLKFEGVVNPAIVTDPEFVRVVPVGNFVHVYVSDINSLELYLVVVKNYHTDLDDPVSLGKCNSLFDVVKVSEQQVLVGRRLGVGTIAVGYLNALGTFNTTQLSWGTVLDPIDVYSFMLAVHPLNGDIGVVWCDTSNFVLFIAYTSTGVLLDASLNFATSASSRVAISPFYLLTEGGKSTFLCYWTPSTGDSVNAIMVNSSSSISSEYVLTAPAHNLQLASRPFLVGNEPFVWAVRKSPLQTSYVLLDRKLKIQGVVEYGQATDPVDILFSTNYSANIGEYKFHGSMMSKRKLGDEIYTELDVKEWYLDFTATTTSAQAGRALYMSGLQMKEYDGSSVVEQGFHFFPEEFTLAPTNGAGTITNGIRSYRIFLCHKNEKGEEIRSACVQTADVTLAGSNDTVTITSKTIPSLRENAYFLIFRNADAGTVWHLVNTRGDTLNNQANATWTFVDTQPDANILDNEQDVSTAPNFIAPFAAPPSTLVAQGKDRLWLVNGETNEVLPSRLFSVYEQPSFSPVNAITVDTSTEPITCLGFVADYVAVFKRTKTYIVAGSGLDNTAGGQIFQSQLAVSDIGAISPFTGRITQGLVFQSLSGYRLFTPAGSVEAIGKAVDPLVTTCSGIVVDVASLNVRCYQTTGFTLVFDYVSGEWANWTLVTPYAFNRETEIYCVQNNKLFQESDVYTDDGKNYVQSFRTAWIGKQLGGFQRVRRIGALGEFNGAFDIVAKLYYDEKDYSEATYTINPTSNTSEWGDGAWGDGVWGDSQQTVETNLFARDNVWRWVRRTPKQKCSCVSLEVSYNGPGRGPVHTAILLELGQKQGLDRIPRF